MARGWGVFSSLVTGFEPVRESLSRRRERGEDFTSAWAASLEEAFPPIVGKSPQAVECRQAREALEATRFAWEQAYGERARMAA